MKYILISTLALTIWMTLFGRVKSNGKVVEYLIPKFFISLWASFFISIVIGLPILGIVYLIISL